MKWQLPFRPSIRTYLILSYLVFIIGGLVSTGLFWFSQQESAAERSLLLQLKERAQLAATANQIQVPPRDAVLLPGTITAINQNLLVFFVTPQFDVRQISYREITGEQRQLAIELTREVFENPSRELEAEMKLAGKTEILYASAPIFDQNQRLAGVVCYILPLQDFRATMQFFRWELVRFSTILAALSLLVGLIMANILSKPIHRAEDLAAQVAGGDFHIRLPSQGPRELQQLADSLNHMAEELEQQAKLRQQLLSNVTHELARPLGALNVGIESLRSGAINDPELSEDLLGEIDRTLKDIDALVNDLALAARPSQVPLHLNIRSVALEPFLHGIQSRYGPVAETRGISLRFEIPCDLPNIPADEVRLNQILGNILDNSLKFCSAGDEIQVSARAGRQGVEISIQDTGPGIPEADHHKVVQPFYQGQSGRLVRQGMGLGLSIVFQLVEAHAGRIKLESAPGGGLLVTVWLPASGNYRGGDQCSSS